jgi:YD repeat-containing protein
MQRMYGGFLIMTFALSSWLASAQQSQASEREAASLAITYSYDQLGQLTGVDYGNGSRIAYSYDDAGNQVLMEVLIADTRALSVNYASGCKGSFFTIRGSGFPPNSQILILVNNIPMSPLVTSGPTGSFTCVLDASDASNGLYVVTAMVVPASGSVTVVEAATAACSATFMITTGAPLRLPDSGGVWLTVPANAALPPVKLFLPMIQH